MTQDSLAAYSNPATVPDTIVFVDNLNISCIDARVSIGLVVLVC